MSATTAPATMQPPTARAVKARKNARATVAAARTRNAYQARHQATSPRVSRASNRPRQRLCNPTPIATRKNSSTTISTTSATVRTTYLRNRPSHRGAIRVAQVRARDKHPKGAHRTTVAKVVSHARAVLARAMARRSQVAGNARGRDVMAPAKAVAPVVVAASTRCRVTVRNLPCRTAVRSSSR